MGAVARQSLTPNENDMDTSSSALGKRDRSMAEPSNIETPRQEAEGKLSRGSAPASKLAVDLAVAQAHAQLGSPDLRSKIEVSQPSVVEGVDGAISAWVADECNRISGQDLTPEEEEVHADSVEAGKLREPEEWEKFDVSPPHEACKVKKQIAQTRWVLNWKRVGGKGRLVRWVDAC